jgi:hypothetical protein
MAQLHDISNRTTSGTLCPCINDAGPRVADLKIRATSACHGQCLCCVVWSSFSHWLPRITTMTTMTKQRQRSEVDDDGNNSDGGDSDVDSDGNGDSDGDCDIAAAAANGNTLMMTTAAFQDGSGTTGIGQQHWDNDGVRQQLWRPWQCWRWQRRQQRQ